MCCKEEQQQYHSWGYGGTVYLILEVEVGRGILVIAGYSRDFWNVDLHTISQVLNIKPLRMHSVSHLF